MKFWQKAYILTLTLFLVTMCASIAVLGVVSQNQSYEAECGKILAQQHALAQNFVTDVAAVNARRPAAVSQLAQNYAAQQKDVFLKVEQGENVWIDTLPIPDTELPEPPEEGKRVHTVRVSDENHFLYVTARLPGPPEKMVMTCAYNIEPFFEQWKQIWRTIILASIGAFLFLAIALYVILRGLSRPMERLALVAGRLAQGDYNTRSQERGKDEVGKLARALNEMADCVQKNIEQLEQSAQNKQQLVDNVAHELRTPLTAIGGYAEYMQRAELSAEERYEVTEYIVNETKRLTAMSERLLRMAALRDEKAVVSPVNISDLLENAFRTLEPKARSTKVCLKKGAISAGYILGEKALLESLLVNLGDNGIKACGQGGTVQLGAEKLPDAIRLWVSDTGCGMDAETIGHLGEPFFRPDKARSREHGGAGLGISLCKAIVKAHDAQLDFDSRPGKGTVVSVYFTTSQSIEENPATAK